MMQTRRTMAVPRWRRTGSSAESAARTGLFMAASWSSEHTTYLGGGKAIILPRSPPHTHTHTHSRRVPSQAAQCRPRAHQRPSSLGSASWPVLLEKNAAIPSSSPTLVTYHRRVIAKPLSHSHCLHSQSDEVALSPHGAQCAPQTRGCEHLSITVPGLLTAE